MIKTSDGCVECVYNVVRERVCKNCRTRVESVGKRIFNCPNCGVVKSPTDTEWQIVGWRWFGQDGDRTALKAARLAFALTVVALIAYWAGFYWHG